MATSYNIGVFDSEYNFLSAIKSLQDNNLMILDVFTPYPVHEVFHLLKRKSRLPTAAYFFGLFGIIATLAFLYYTCVISWPLIYGGKPFNSFPSFIVVTIVVTIFTVTVASLALFSLRSRLFPGRDNTIFNPGATDDKFVIVVEPGPSYMEKSGSIFQENGAVEVYVKEIEKVEV